MEERIVTIGGRSWHTYVTPLTGSMSGWGTSIPPGWGVLSLNPNQLPPGQTTTALFYNPFPYSVDVITIVPTLGESYVSGVWNYTPSGGLVQPTSAYVQILFVRAGEAAGVTQGEAVTIATGGEGLGMSELMNLMVTMMIVVMMMKMMAGLA